MTLIDVKCFGCKYFQSQLHEDGIYFCDAFPNKEERTPEDLKKREDEGLYLDPKGIPDEIILGENDHSEPIEGQVGDFVFTPKEEE